MTGVTLQLTPSQADELRSYADGRAITGQRPNRHLIRRVFVQLVGRGTYRITSLGLAALERRSDG